MTSSEPRLDLGEFGVDPELDPTAFPRAQAAALLDQVIQILEGVKGGFLNDEAWAVSPQKTLRRLQSSMSVCSSILDALVRSEVP